MDRVKLANSQTLLIALAIIGVQITISTLWLKHYRFGPLEWLWRSATYLERQPLRRQISVDRQFRPPVRSPRSSSGIICDALILANRIELPFPGVRTASASSSVKDRVV